MSEDIRNIIVNIGGMSCTNCKDKIENALSNTQGVISAVVDLSLNNAKIEFDASLTDYDTLKKVITELGYKIKSDKAPIFYPLAIFAIIVALYIPLQAFGILNYLAPEEIADSSMGYGMLFVIGLITSVHCIAMCGGINLSQCIPKSQENSGKKAFLPALLYNFGRVLSYTVIGFILGLIGFIIGGGKSVGISSILQGAIKIIAGVMMIIMGVNMLGIAPILRKVRFMPRSLSKAIGKKKASSKSPFFVGILNGIMPCGPLQAMWLVSLSTGNPFSGALSMFLFALGTVPLMLGLGTVVSKLGQKFSRAVMTVGSILVVVLGLSMLSQGGSLTGFAFMSPTVLSVVVLSLIFMLIIFSIRFEVKSLKILTRVTAACLVVAVSVAVFAFGGQDTSDFDRAQQNGNVQVVKSQLDSGTYPNIAVKKGVPVRWIIEADKDDINGCNYEIIIPAFDITYTFHVGENIIEFTPDEAGTFDYSCWMGMIYGVISVE